MAYRRTENVARRLAARRAAIVAAACETVVEEGLAAVQIVEVAARAGIAAGTVYRYFPSKTELVAAALAALGEREMAAIERAARAAPGPLSALAAAVTIFTARAVASPRLAIALIADGAQPAVVRNAYRAALAARFDELIRNAIAAGRLPDQDAAMAASALIGALSAGVVGPRPPAAAPEATVARAQVQSLALFALRALGVVDARARGLVVQTVLPQPG
ncbi:MAG TPA: helix-turn-helix domain-containing protein [Xanthobacteraceae bacterium]|jgi:AcrR family transcriptional regulator